MALSSDEERILVEIGQRLSHDDPIFARRAAAMQRRMWFREIVPFYRPLCLLFTVVSVIMVVAVIATASHGDDTGPPVKPSHQVSADEQTFPLVEPR
jgi:hypothetical protein